MEKVKCLIIGSGPAGYTAAIYTSRANLNPVLYEGIEPGGQLTTTTEIDNYPGYPEGIDGNQLMGHMRKQAERFGADIRRGTVTRADLSSRPFHLVVDGEKQIEADSLIIATGASARYLGLPSQTKYRGQGVSACATCDGFFYRKKDVAVVGGGDTACEEATYLASICRQVYMIVRKPYLRASKAMQHRVMNTPNIEVLFEYNTAEVLGDDTGVTGVTIRHNDGKERTLAVAGFFVAIGHHPNTELFRNQLELDAEGYIRTEGNSSKTSVEGVFAAGDVQDPAYRQAITAAGSGCIAALDCERFLLQEAGCPANDRSLLCRGFCHFQHAPPNPGIGRDDGRRTPQHPPPVVFRRAPHVSRRGSSLSAAGRATKRPPESGNRPARPRSRGAPYRRRRRRRAAGGSPRASSRPVSGRPSHSL